MKVVVIGGGFAGLSAATALAEKGFHVTLLEGRQVLGGRAYSFRDAQTQDAVDNGQHLFMGCYRETQRFLGRVGTLEQLVFQPNLEVDFMAAGGRQASLRCWPLPAPWHLLSGLMRLSTLSWGDRWRMRHVHRALRAAVRDPRRLDGLTIEQWLKSLHQSERARHHLWDLIAIATLNESPAIAAAAPFATVLAQAFFEGREGSRLGIAAVGLSELYAHAARTYLESRGATVRTKSPVEQIQFRDGRAVGVTLRHGEHVAADWVVSAVSPGAFLRLLPSDVLAAQPILAGVRELKTAPIISIHLWLDREITDKAFVGLLDTQVQWLFNKSKIYPQRHADSHFISLVMSGAHSVENWSETRLLAMALEELRRLFPSAQAAHVLRSLVIKEHQATLSPTVNSEALRPTHRTPIPRLLLAGDWTKTGLPATIESACVSGHACARLIEEEEPHQPSTTKEVAYV